MDYTLVVKNNLPQDPKLIQRCINSIEQQNPLPKKILTPIKLDLEIYKGIEQEIIMDTTMNVVGRINTEFFSFVDLHNVLYKNKFSKQIEVATKHPEVIIVTSEFDKQNGNNINKVFMPLFFPEFFISKNTFVTDHSLFRTEAIKKIGSVNNIQEFFVKIMSLGMAYTIPESLFLEN